MMRLGVVGAGWILSTHLAALAELVAAGVEVKITAIASSHIDRVLPLLQEESSWSEEFVARPTAMKHMSLHSFQPHVEVAVFNDHRALIKSGLVDAVLDLTPPQYHHVVGVDALEAGLHVLTEKPLGISVRAASLVVSAARRHRRVLAVAETFRCMAEPQLERQVIASGRLGALRHVSWSNLGGSWAPDIVVASTPWRHDRLLAGGGTTLDNGVHAIDWLRYTVGEIESVSALTLVSEPIRHILETGLTVPADADDTLEATLAFNNGTIGNLALSWAQAGSETPLPNYRGAIGSMVGGVVTVGTSTTLTDAVFELVAPENRFTNPFAEQLYRWIRAIEGDGAPAVSGDEGLRDVTVCMAMLESSVERAWVDVNDVASGRLRRYQADVDLFHSLD